MNNQPDTASGTTTTNTIRIRTLDGKTISIQAEPDWTVKRLKKEFGEWKGAGFERVNLHYRAKRLKDEDLLSKYNIESDGFVLANIRSTGGVLSSTFHIGFKNCNSTSSIMQ